MCMSYVHVGELIHQRVLFEQPHRYSRNSQAVQVFPHLRRDRLQGKLSLADFVLFLPYVAFLTGFIILQMSELELLTYWLTYLYCRCTKSVSYATPAYYAHWAARRGKVLLNAGVSSSELTAMSQSWLKEDMLPGMYFI